MSSVSEEEEPKKPHQSSGAAKRPLLSSEGLLLSPSRWRPLRLTPPSPPHGVDSAERSEDLHVRMFGAGANQAPILFNVASHRAPGHCSSRDENLMDPTRDGDSDGPKFLPVWAWLRWSTLKAGTDPGLSSPPLSSGRTD